MGRGAKTNWRYHSDAQELECPAWRSSTLCPNQSCWSNAKPQRGGCNFQLKFKSP